MLEQGHKIAELLVFLGAIRKEDTEIKAIKIIGRLLLPFIIPVAGVAGGIYLSSHDNAKDIASMQKEIDQNKKQREDDIASLREDLRKSIEPIQTMLAIIVSKQK